MLVLKFEEPVLDGIAHTVLDVRVLFPVDDTQVPNNLVDCQGRINAKRLEVGTINGVRRKYLFHGPEERNRHVLALEPLGNLVAGAVNDMVHDVGDFLQVFRIGYPQQPELLDCLLDQLAELLVERRIGLLPLLFQRLLRAMRNGVGLGGDAGYALYLLRKRL